MRVARIRGSSWLPVLCLLTSGCSASLRDTLAYQNWKPCSDLTKEHKRIAALAAYRKSAPRARLEYDYKVVDCYLAAKEPAKAEEIAATWAESDVAHYSSFVASRVAAAKGRRGEARELLHEAVAKGFKDLHLAVLAKEFAPFRDEKWMFIGAVRMLERQPAELWQHRTGDILREFIESADAPLLKPPTNPSTGGSERMVAWLGVVQDSWIDESGNGWILMEAVIRETRRVGSERVLRSASWFGGFSSFSTFSGSSGSGYGSAAMNYDVRDTYREEFVPTGERFLVHVTKATQADGKHVLVVGEYLGATLVDPLGNRPFAGVNANLVVSRVGREWVMKKSE